jgi:cytochrome c
MFQEFYIRKTNDMKTSLIVLLAAFAIACNSNGEADKKEATEKLEEVTASGTKLPAGITQDDYDKGLNLVATSDCLTCHDINKKITGPSYAEIANKYEVTDANITMLAGKIITGGKGNWGEIPMTPHADLSEEEAKTMVKYVLSLKNAQ